MYKEFICDKCNKVYNTKQQYGGHRAHCGKLREKKEKKIVKKRVAWNKGKTKETDLRIKKIAETIKKKTEMLLRP